MIYIILLKGVDTMSKYEKRSILLISIISVAILFTLLLMILEVKKEYLNTEEDTKMNDTRRISRTYRITKKADEQLNVLQDIYKKNLGINVSQSDILIKLLNDEFNSIDNELK